MNFNNWTLSVSAPITEYFRESNLDEAVAAGAVITRVRRAAYEAGESPHAFSDWLTNIGCAATNIVFFDGSVPSRPTKVNLILIAPNVDFASAIRDEREKAPKSVNYFYTTLNWLGERPFESSLFPFPEWTLGVLSASHVVLSAPGYKGSFDATLGRVRSRVMNDLDGHIAELVAADIYAGMTARLPKGRSIASDLPSFWRERSKSGLSEGDMTDMAIHAMEKRGVKPERRKPLMKALAAYCGGRCY